MLSFKEWSQSYEANKENNGDDANDAKDESSSNEIAEVIKVPTNEAIDKIKGLCRICSSNGLISIQSKINVNNLKVRMNSGDLQNWDAPISKLIADISGQEVSWREEILHHPD